MNIKYVRKPEETNHCAAACVAMVTGKSIEETVSAFKDNTGVANTKEVADALHSFGIECEDKLTRINEKTSLPDTCLVKLRIGKYTNTRWAVWHNGRYYDPEYGITADYPPDIRATAFLSVFNKN